MLSVCASPFLCQHELTCRQASPFQCKNDARNGCRELNQHPTNSAWVLRKIFGWNCSCKDDINDVKNTIWRLPIAVLRHCCDVDNSGYDVINYNKSSFQENVLFLIFFFSYAYIRIRSAGGIFGFPQLLYSPRYSRGGRRGRRLPPPHSTVVIYFRIKYVTIVQTSIYYIVFLGSLLLISVCCLLSAAYNCCYYRPIHLY